jgi:CPA1 family monovalent cation:H+ antiporter
MTTSIETIATDLAWLLLGASLLGILASRLHVPYAAILVVAGLVVAETGLSVPRLEPSLVLLIFLPPLLFDGAFRLDSRELVGLIRPVLLLALPGTLLTAAVIGGLVWWLLRVPIAVALLFGGVVAPTDPVAVVAVFRRLRVGKRLTVALEAESLFNDGVALALYSALSTFASTGATQVGTGVVQFLWEVLAGVGLGVAFGFVFSHLTRLTNDHLTEIMVSTALAYGSYLAGDAVGASGALTCIAAGIVHGSYGRQIGLSARARRLLDDVWEYFGFFANGLLFLLVGFSAPVTVLAGETGPLTAAVVAVLIARVLLIASSNLLRAGDRPGRSVGQQAVLVWGGLRGALTVTLALALPTDTPMRDLVIAMAFGVVLFTLVAQGLTLPWLIRLLGLDRGRAPAGPAPATAPASE